MSEIKYPLIPDRMLPPVIRELVSNAPANFKVPTFFAAAPCLAAIATRIRAYYPFDSDPHALLLQCIISGEQSSGKSSPETTWRRSS